MKNQNSNSKGVTPESFSREKFWYVPKPSTTHSTGASSSINRIKVNQRKFYEEFYPSGHKINSPLHFPDVPIIDENDKIIDYHHVNRVTIPFQQMAVDIISAHLLGNKTNFIDSTIGMNDNKTVSKYKELWQTKDMDVSRYEFIASCLSSGDSAIIFYRDGKELKNKVLSYMNEDTFYVKNDKYGNMSHFARFYSIENEDGSSVEMCDIYDDKKISSWNLSGSEPSMEESTSHGFGEIPVVYFKRRDGAIWSPAQPNIDNLELMLSRLSEDNRTKAKAKYHLSTDDPNGVDTMKDGDTDIIITGLEDEFKLLSGADISTQFKFEYETEIEAISNSLGIVFPKSKSSGDMPTGSMKMIFFPTERVVMKLIAEFTKPLNEINEKFKKFITPEVTKEDRDFSNALPKVKIKALIRMFTPQDDSSIATMLGQSVNYGIISKQTAREFAPYAANDENERVESEEREAKANEIEYQAQTLEIQSQSQSQSNEE